MSILKSSNVSSFARRSSRIFDVFTKTVEECESLNGEIEKVKNDKEAEIKNLQTEVTELYDIMQKNDKLSKKITAFVNGVINTDN